MLPEGPLWSAMTQPTRRRHARERPPGTIRRDPRGLPIDGESWGRRGTTRRVRSPSNRRTIRATRSRHDRATARAKVPRRARSSSRIDTAIRRAQPRVRLRSSERGSDRQLDAPWRNVGNTKTAGDPMASAIAGSPPSPSSRHHRRRPRDQGPRPRRRPPRHRRRCRVVYVDNRADYITPSGRRVRAPPVSRSSSTCSTPDVPETKLRPRIQARHRRRGERQAAAWSPPPCGEAPLRRRRPAGTWTPSSMPRWPGHPGNVDAIGYDWGRPASATTW